MTWALVVVVGLLLAERFWQARQAGAERRLLVEAVLSRHAPDLALLERSSRPARKKPKPPDVFDVDGNRVDPADMVIVGMNGN